MLLPRTIRRAPNHAPCSDLACRSVGVGRRNAVNRGKRFAPHFALWRCLRLTCAPFGLRLRWRGGRGLRPLCHGAAFHKGRPAFGQLALEFASRNLFWCPARRGRPTGPMHVGADRGRAMRRVRSRQWRMRPRRGQAVQQFGALRTTPSSRQSRASMGGACTRQSLWSMSSQWKCQASPLPGAHRSRRAASRVAERVRRTNSRSYPTEGFTIK